jgi:hypothetical protein
MSSSTAKRRCTQAVNRRKRKLVGSLAIVGFALLALGMVPPVKPYRVTVSTTVTLGGAPIECGPDFPCNGPPSPDRCSDPDYPACHVSVFANTYTDDAVIPSSIRDPSFVAAIYILFGVAVLITYSSKRKPVDLTVPLYFSRPPSSLLRTLSHLTAESSCGSRPNSRAITSWPNRSLRPYESQRTAARTFSNIPGRFGRHRQLARVFKWFAPEEAYGPPSMPVDSCIWTLCGNALFFSFSPGSVIYLNAWSVLRYCGGGE